ncbi:FAD-dependent oxidoreductase [Caldalkalibacillus salinus]|uniref:FAD-dependent oxidoreductase n=1 Tax=Caldalkalibacillus salinus TaxID=2803787 RepID=UPI0019221CAD|nr:FAD-dependent oxidoreductase [Caldalkalibacillus salinus]
MAKVFEADIIIIGGGIGGCSAALAAAKSGKKVIVTEETKWIGGQLTSQAVPPDEHRWIEQFGCTQTYRQFRDRVRAYYKREYPLTSDARREQRLNPGNAWVSRIAHEPRVALNVIETMLAPYMSNGTITILKQHKMIDAEVEKDHILSVTVRDMVQKQRKILVGSYFLDATEIGDVLPHAGVEYVTGAESQEQTGEPNAHSGEAKPLDMQSITHCMAVDYVEGGDFTIEKPEQYDFWKDYQASFLDHKQLSWYGPDASTGESRPFSMFPGDSSAPSLWDYRRLIDPTNFEADFFEGGISILNWPQNDYWLGPVYEVDEEERERHLYGAKQLTLSLLYWLQTEAPREKGGYGYPGLRPRGDIVGTDDGLALHPYIRESRRIKAEHTVLEQHINADVRGDKGIKHVPDSVGVGSYWIDLHPTVETNRLFFAPSYPFEIPLGSMIPIRVENLIPAAKNIGVTHLTNGCFRLHPVEWNIGEAAGYLAAYALEHGRTPREIYHDEETLSTFQSFIVSEGIEIKWPEIGILE